MEGMIELEWNGRQQRGALAGLIRSAAFKGGCGYIQAFRLERFEGQGE